MNFSTLSSNEKLGVYGSIAVIIGILIASGGFFGFGLGFLALIAAIAMLVVIFLPQMSAGTSLPGSKGTLMFAAGIIAAAVLVITMVQLLGFIGAFLGSINGIFFLIAVIGSLVMAWAGWNELQTEGGSFRFGSGGTSDTRPGSPTGSTTGSTSGSTGSTLDSTRDRSTTGSTTGSTSASTTGMGSTGPASTSVGSTSAGSTDMGFEGGAVRRDDDEGTLRNP